MSDMEQAKKMFFDFACNHFFMWHDGMSKEYKKFNISKSQEEEWRKEFIAIWTGKLAVDGLKAIEKLREAGANEAIPDLMNMASHGDGWDKLWCAWAIWDLANNTNVSPEIRKQANGAAIDLWESLVQGAIQLSESHKADIVSNYMKSEDATAEEHVLKRAQFFLKQAKSQGLTLKRSKMKSSL